ncbi:hypothetical protein C8R43DRAFT_1043409 [Mycena crocata]|nr:hypothetical protein C8R43DRAFT_1043409 [Mycena crocata]
MSMPQELVDAILDDMKDTESLKACALVAHSFRDSSQRNLFHSWTLSVRNYAAGRTLLTESPHLAAYIRRFNLDLPGVDIGTKTVLDKLVNVHRFTIEGAGTRWGRLPALDTAILGFIERQPLRQLHIRSIYGLPHSALALLVSSAPTISFYFVSLQWGFNGDFTSRSSRHVSKLDSLLLVNSSEVSEALSSAQFAFSTARLRKVGCFSHSRLFTAAAATLEHIRFDLSDSDAQPLPHLPALRFIDFRITQFHPLLTSLPIIIPSRPACLQEVSITYPLRTADIYPLFTPQKVSIIQQSLADFPPTLLLRWRIILTWDDTGDHVQVLDSFANLMKEALFEIEGRGKLIIERGNSDEWAVR